MVSANLILYIFCNFGNCIFRRSRNVAVIQDWTSYTYIPSPKSRVARLHTFSDIKTFCPLVETMPEQIVLVNLDFWPKPRG